MNKLILLICIFISALLLWSCAPYVQSYISSDLCSSDTFISLTPTTEQLTNRIISTTHAPATREYVTVKQELELHFYEFLDALVSCDMEKLISFGGVRSPEAYTFWEGTDVVGYKVLDRQPCDRVGREDTYTVELDIKSSSHELFPVGKSMWSITTEYSESGFLEPLRPADIFYEEIKQLGMPDYNMTPATSFCYCLTVELDSYFNSLPNGRTCDNFNLLVPDYGRKSVLNNVY